VVAAFAVASACLIAQQAAPPTFRSATQLVVQTVSVKDKNGAPIAGLTARDFLVTENGQPQQIAFVEYQPLDDAPPAMTAEVASAPRANPPDPAFPIGRDAALRGRRLLVLYFDLYNMPFFDQMRGFAAADRFVGASMSPADAIAIVVFDKGTARLKQTFTADRETLHRMLAQLIEEANDVNNGVGGKWDPGSGFGEDNDTFSLFSTDRQLSALQTTVTDLGPLPEVKTLIYFGSGLRLSGADNQAQLRATVNAAVRANVTINPIDTRGLTAAAPLGDATRASPGGIGMFNGVFAEAATTRQQQSHDSYHALARDTGGRAMFDDNDLTRGIVQAARAVTAYYMIGYYTSNTAMDGRFRRVKIALAAGLAADLSYRAGYYGAKSFARFNAADKERQLEEAFRLEDPITDIPMAMEVNYFQLNHAEYFVPVSVRMPGSELTRASPGRPTRTDIDVLAEIKDQHGVTIRNLKDRLQFTLDASTAAQAARRPIQYETGFTLLPGEYLIKVLARDGTTGRMGTFVAPFTVPNLERERVRLPISSVVMSAQRVAPGEALFNVKQKIASDAAHPLIAQGRKLIPAVTRTFDARRPLFVFLHAYEHDAPVMRPLVVIVAVYRGSNKIYEATPVPVTAGWDPVSKAVPISLTIPAGSLPRGDYKCQITVLDPEARRAAFWRAAMMVTDGS
jgi:VWFA-related protein